MIKLYATASPLTVASARIIVLGLWVAYLVGDPIWILTGMPVGLLHLKGVMRIFPTGFWEVMLAPGTLVFFWVSILLALIYALIGLPRSRVAVVLALGALLIYLQIEKGFGGHWDHRELTLLYVTAVLPFTRGWDTLAVSREKAPVPGNANGNRYQADMLSLALIVVGQYVFVGIARLSMGTPQVFEGALAQWILQRTVRPNPYGFEPGLWLAETVTSQTLDLALLLATVLEISSFLIFFLAPRFRLLMLIGLALLHISIFFFMNTLFFENLVLLLLLADFAGLNPALKSSGRRT